MQFQENASMEGQKDGIMEGCKDPSGYREDFN